MHIRPFALERYFSEREFTARYRLSSSDCESLAMEELLELADDDSLELWQGLKLGYTRTRGASFLREEIAGLYRGLRPEDFLVAAPVECIFVAMNSILDAGDHVICTFPGYQALGEVASAIGCEVERWSADERQGWRFDPEWLEEHVRGDTKLIVVNFPHNPTGAQASLEDLGRIVEAARQWGAYLFSDEIYRFLEREADELPPACELYERAVSLGGLSKAFGLPGLRMGWLATREVELMEAMASFKDYTTICSSAPGEVLATMALRARVTILERNRSIIAGNLDALDEFFERHNGLFYWNRPAAGPVAFPRLLTESDADALCEEVLAETGVLLLPGTVFDFGGRHVRVGFGRRDLPRALEALDGFLSGKAGL